jgi:hypothetical protein
MAIAAERRYFYARKRAKGGIMSKLKAADLVAFAKKALSEKWGYVFGAQGEEYSKELAQQWAKTRRPHSGWVLSRAAYFVTACKKWFGHRVTDCSGLIIAAFRAHDPKYEDQSANTLISRCSKSGAISSIPDTPGLCVWRSGHIGIHIGGGKVIEASGYSYGVKQSTVSKDYKGNKWKKWGMLADVDYDSVPEPASKPSAAPYKFALKRKLKLRRVRYMRGSDVKAVQEALAALGYSLGKIDGIFGKKTYKAVREFQAAKHLVVDGIVGPITAAALGGKWG